METLPKRNAVQLSGALDYLTHAQILKEIYFWTQNRVVGF